MSAPTRTVRISTAQALRALNELEASQVRLRMTIERKRSLRDSERAMWLTEVDYRMAALSIAIELLECREDDEREEGTEGSTRSITIRKDTQA
jgi:hypothetical protein